MEEVKRVASKELEVVLLPRDPESGYVYWTWPGAEAAGESARLVLLSGEEEVLSFEVREARGGRFLNFAESGGSHHCRLEWSKGQEESALVEAPRREPGQEGAAFVKVEWSEEGLKTVPTTHEDEIHGSFPAGKPRKPTAPTSTSFHR